MPHVRCRRCDARRTLAMHPDHYLRKPPKCRGCGRSHEYRVDKYRMTVERGPKAPKACNCYGYSFSHRRGSLYCQHNPNLTPEMLCEREEYGRWA